MKPPLVTVYIPTFNRLQLLKRAVDSVLDQVYPNIEIIIIDDCSTDGTDLFLSLLARERPSIQYFRNESNIGACASRNKAINNAKGEYITGLDDDDYFTPERISDFVDLWNRKTGNTIALTSSRRRIVGTGQSEYLPGLPLTTLDQMYLRNLIGSQVFTKTQTARSLGGFDTALGAWQDYEFLLRLLKLGDVENTMKYTYIVDASHSHERISTASYKKVEAACDYIISKHSVTGMKALGLESQLLVYHFSYRLAVKLSFRFLMHADINGIKAILMRFYRSKLKS